MLDLGEAILKAQLSVEGSSPRRFGILASLAFRRYVRLYRKYSENQPRDERGRWTETDDENEDGGLTTGTIVQRYRSGNPDVDSVTEILEHKMQEVLDRLGPGWGAMYGVQFHVAFAQAVRETNISGIGSVGVEQSLLEGAWFATVSMGACGRTSP